ncbi:MAG: M1 family metallopeptidase, partial [Saprospiraceae bacterium]
FEGQVPLQIRRSGRFNKEGIEYSMAQWYPKMCNYDYQGWHANPYVSREFYGIWGDYDVTITLPKEYVIGGTGVLQNKNEIGHGYSAIEPATRPDKLSWHFRAENVHDFMWAADTDYRQIAHTTADGLTIRCFFQPGSKTTENWTQLPAIMEEAFRYINKKYGKYPYSDYSFIQGGDGGMEYPMATLITGERTLVSLVGVSVHELMHTWYQMLMGTNEALYAWMDEGFTSYASNEVMNHLRQQKLIPGAIVENPHLQDVKKYINFALSGNEEALTTHSDHFNTNTAYGVAAYTKGEVFLEQLRYIIGEDAFDKGMLLYYDTWRFKHPNPNDFIRIMEKVSGLELDWFKEYFVYTTLTMDYEITEMRGKSVVITRNGRMPMPLDVTVTAKDGKIYKYYIPQEIMRGEKKGDRFFDEFKVMEDWAWTHPSYFLDIGMKIKDVEKIEIDASQRMADVNRQDNIFPRVYEMKAGEMK